MLAMVVHENIHLRNEQRPYSHRLTLKGNKITPPISWAFHLTFFSLSLLRFWLEFLDFR